MKKQYLAVACAILALSTAFADDSRPTNVVSEKTTVPTELNRHSHHPRLDGHIKTDSKTPKLVYFICHKWNATLKAAKYYRQCSSVYFYNLNYRYKHKPRFSKQYFGLHHPYYKCGRLNYGHYHYKTFTTSADAWRWRSHNCGDDRVYRRY